MYVKSVCTQSNIYFLSIKPSGSFDRPVLQWYFVTQNCSDLLDENYSSDWENLLKFEAEGKNFGITRKTYSNSESSEEYLVTACSL